MASRGQNPNLPLAVDLVARLDSAMPAHYRAMFGGYGVYLDGVIVGIIAYGKIYFKTDEDTKRRYQELGSRAFSYETSKGTRASMHYWEVPKTILRDTPALIEWALAARQANLKAKKKAK